jgi:SAM-dependent methyltransferase
MGKDGTVDAFIARIAACVAAGSFVTLSLRDYRGTVAGLKRIDIRRILVKREECLSFTYHYATRDIVKNHAASEAMTMVAGFWEDGFTRAVLQSTAEDVTLTKKGGVFTLISTAAKRAAPDLSHDRAKHRHVDPSRPYLQALGISDAKGNVIKSAQDKFRQIDKYIEVLGGLVKDLPTKHKLRIVDMGSGKGYLTFALYDYLNTQGVNVEVVGVEFRADMVALCNRIARESGMAGLRFVEGSIASHDCNSADIVIALHACDTATDDAIFKAVQASARLIVVAPCCHKQIRREMEAAKAENGLAFLTRYGTFMERQAEMVTDGLRALLLEREGYKVSLFEFISDAHTPKNVMIVATQENANAARRADSARAIAAAKSKFGVAVHHLERLLDSQR